MTDGPFRLVERHHYTWTRLLDLLAAKDGTRRAIDTVRNADAAADRSAYRGEAHDDVTVRLRRTKIRRRLTHSDATAVDGAQPAPSAAGRTPGRHVLLSHGR